MKIRSEQPCSGWSREGNTSLNDFKAIAFAKGIQASAISFLWNSCHGSRVTGQIIDEICSSEEFIQNPRDAIVSYLIDDFKGNGARENHDVVFASLMGYIPDFEQVATDEYLEALGESRFAHYPMKQKNACMDLLRESLKTPDIKNHLKDFIAFYNSGKESNAEDVASAYFLSAQDELKEALSILPL